MGKTKTKEELQKEIELLKSQLKSLQKKKKWRRPSSRKKGSGWLLQNEEKWDLILGDFVETYVENTRIINKNIQGGKNLKHFKEVCEKHGFPGVTMTNLRQIITPSLLDSKERFIKKYDNSLEKIFELSKIRNKEIDKESMDSFLKSLEKNNGDFRNTQRHYKTSLNRLINTYPDFEKRIELVRKKCRDLNWKEWCDGCIERFDQFVKLGLSLNDSLYLSGIGTYLTKNNQTIDFFRLNPKFEKRFLHLKGNSEKIDHSIKDWNHLKESENYIKKIKSINSDFKIKKWVNGTKRKQWNLSEIHFQKPDYEVIFNDRIKTLINRNLKSHNILKVRVEKNEKSGRLKIKESNIRKRKRKEYLKKNPHLKQSYLYRTKEDVLNDPNFFKNFEKKLLKHGYNKIPKTIKELNISRWVYGDILKKNIVFKRKIIEIQTKVRFKRIQDNIDKFLEELTINKGDYQLTLKNFKGHKGLWKSVDPDWENRKDKIVEYFSKNNWENWLLESYERFKILNDRGLGYVDSIRLSGLGDYQNGIVFKNLVRIKPEVKKEVEDRMKVDPKLKLRMVNNFVGSTFEKELLKKKEEYLNLLKEIKEEKLLEFKPYLKKNPNGSYTIQRNGKSVYLPSYQHYFKHKVDVVIKETIKWVETTRKSVERTEKLNKISLSKIPIEYRDLIKFISPKRTEFYSIDNQLIVKYCGRCGELKTKKEFPGISRVSSYCIECRRKRRGSIGSGRIGEVYKGKIIRKYNSSGNVIERRCNSCDKFKHITKFNHRWRGSSVCDDCYVDLPNNVLTRKNEFHKGVQVRVYDPKTYLVLKKRCNRCKEMLPVENFGLNNYQKIDGRSPTCKSCTKIKK